MSTTDSGERAATFEKAKRLRRPAEFRSVYRRGTRRVSSSFVAFVLSGTKTQSRYGLTTPRKLGRAHERNRIRRRVREILRRDYAMLPPGRDIVLNPRRSVLTRDWASLRSELRALLQD